jgi:hypothetical protein
VAVPSSSAKDASPDAAYAAALLVLFECALLLGICTLSRYLIIEQKFDILDPEEMPINSQLRLDASRRRIAEFFANVIIRFVLQDLSTLIHKYVKRASEWVVS